MSLSSLVTPARFFTARLEVRGEDPEMTILCGGYERGEWRQADFVTNRSTIGAYFSLTLGRRVLR